MVKRTRKGASWAELSCYACSNQEKKSVVYLVGPERKKEAKNAIRHG